MLESGREFASLMEQVRAGCPDAARAVFEKYSPHIRRTVRRRLAKRLRTQFDSVDFLQAVWASFFLTPSEQYTFASPAELVRYLCATAEHKCIDAYRRGMGTQKRDLSREMLLTDLGQNLEVVQPLDRSPTPSQTAAWNELWERLNRCESPKLRRVAELLRQGRSYRQIAAECGLPASALKRFLRRMFTGETQP
jgi:RNA polymerase sigma-70 factor (ECF subfamily)